MVTIKNIRRHQRPAWLCRSRLSQCVGWERYRSADQTPPPPQEEPIQRSTSNEPQNKPPTNNEPVEDDPWADVLCAIRNDLRAFWGLWESVIAPRLDPGLPVTYKDAAKWKGDGVDLDLVFSCLRRLTRQVKPIIDNHVPKTSESQAVHARLKSLLADAEKDYKPLQCIFIKQLLLYADMPDFAYPHPVD
jgi:hypothetical protein